MARGAKEGVAVEGAVVVVVVVVVVVGVTVMEFSAVGAG